MSEDRIYTARDGAEPFRFDETVARVFPDMLRRSVPGYQATLEAIGSLADRYVCAASRCYDLGCSLGAASLAMRQGIRAPGCRIIAIDSAPAMIARCREVVAADDARQAGATPIEVVEGDIRDADIRDASMAVLNYTLQFLTVGDRDALISRIADGMPDRGVLVLSEKVVDPDTEIERLLSELHHEYKRRNHYTALEVARKRAALENVLVPESVARHRARLEKAGFRHTGVWLRHFNFVSIVAIR